MSEFFKFHTKMHRIFAKGGTRNGRKKMRKKISRMLRLHNLILRMKHEGIGKVTANVLI